MTTKKDKDRVMENIEKELSQIIDKELSDMTVIDSNTKKNVLNDCYKRVQETYIMLCVIEKTCALYKNKYSDILVNITNNCKEYTDDLESINTSNKVEEKKIVKTPTKKEKKTTNKKSEDNEDNENDDDKKKPVNKKTKEDSDEKEEKPKKKPVKKENKKAGNKK